MYGQTQLLYFEASYTLDILCFLDLLFIDVLSKEEELVTHFEGMLSEGCSKVVKNARKKLPKQESFMSVILPLLAADPEFNDLRLSELLGSPKYLTSKIKQHPNYKQLSKHLKKFIRKDAAWVIGQISLVISELEKAKFKTFWIEKRLPLIKSKIKQYDKEIQSLRLIENFNEWLVPNRINKRTVYILSFYEGNQMQLLNYDIMSSVNSSSANLIQALVDQSFSNLKFENELKLLAKQVKNNPDLIQAYQAVKGEYKQVAGYLEKNIHLALITYFYQKFNVLDQPYEYLGRYNFGTHRLSVLFYQYIHSYPKEPNQLFKDYLLKMTEEIELDRFEQQFLGFMNQQL